MIEIGEAEMIASEVHLLENNATTDPGRQAFVSRLLTLAKRTINADEGIARRARSLCALNLHPGDALHLAAAEAASCSHFITCDDKLIRRYRGPLLSAAPPTFITSLGRSYED